MNFKTTLVVSALISSSFLVATPASANEQLAASLCDYVAADDKSRLRKKLIAAGMGAESITTLHGRGYTFNA